MTRPLSLVLFLLITTTCGFAGVDWFGYFESEADFAKVPAEDFYFGYNKIRLDMEANPNDNIRISANLISKFHHGRTEMNFLEFLHPNYYPLAGNGNNQRSDDIPFVLRDTLLVDNAFLEFHYQRFDLTVGRQQISPGLGYAWNPADIFNQKDPMDPTYEQTGVDALRLDVSLPGDLALMVVLKPEEDWASTTSYLRLKVYPGQFDLGVLYGHTLYHDALSNADVSRNMVGGLVEGEFLGFGLRTECVANFLDRTESGLKLEYIIGADYTFHNSLYVLLEYLHNEFGTEYDKTSFSDYSAYLAGERKSLNRDYAFVMAMYPVGSLTDVSLSLISNLEDSSVVANPQLVYRVVEDVEISMMGSIFFGKDRSEFGYQEAGARLRLKAYF
jgi:hypothetical protein